MLVGAQQVAGARLQVVALGDAALRVQQRQQAVRGRAGFGHHHGLHANVVVGQRGQGLGLGGTDLAGIFNVVKQLKARIHLAQQPAGAAAADGGIVHGCAGHHVAGKCVAVGGVQRRIDQPAGHRQAARIDQGAGKGVVLRQLQHRVAKGFADVALGRDEVGRARGVHDVLVGGVAALGAVAVQQRGGGLAVQHQFQFPGQVVGVLNAAVGPTCAKGRDLVRRIAHKQHAVVVEPAHAAALEGVDADPFQLKLALVAQHGLDAGDDVFGLFLGLGVGIPAQLKVDAPDVVGLLVQQHRLVAVEGRVKPEPALGRVVGLHDHVGNQEAVHENFALNVQPQHGANGRARAVRGHQPIGRQGVGTVGRFHAHGGLGIVLLHADDVVFKAHLQVGQLAGAGHQVVLQVVLLQVHHAGALVAFLGAQVEVEHLAIAKKGAAHVPGHAFFHGRRAAVQAVEHFQRALGIAHAARADGDGVVVVQQQHLLALGRQVNRHGQTHRPRANDHHGVVAAALLGHFGRADVLEFGVGVGG